jgi:hypothetical protein
MIYIIFVIIIIIIINLNLTRLSIILLKQKFTAINLLRYLLQHIATR